MDPQDQALPVPIEDVETRPMGSQETHHHGQPEAPARFLGGGERIADQVQLVRWNARAIIGDLQADRGGDTRPLQGPDAGFTGPGLVFPKVHMQP